MIYYGMPGFIVFLIVFFSIFNFVMYKKLWDKINSFPERSMTVFDLHQTRKSSPTNDPNL